MDQRTAFVTGASRGIGKAIAIWLARAGYDVAITARTVKDGEAREHSSTIARSNTSPLPGSLSTTADLIRAEDREALTVPGDLLDRASLGAAVGTVLERWGGVDVLVNNGRYIGPGHMDRFLDTPIELLDAHLEANVMAPLVLAKLVLPGMIERGDGLIVDMSSLVAWTDPPAAAGEGGWGLGYAMSKGALHRVAGVLHQELHDRGIVMRQHRAGLRRDGAHGRRHGRLRLRRGRRRAARRHRRGRRVARRREANADEWAGRLVPAQQLCHDLGLLPDWSGPVPNPGEARDE